MSNVPVVASLQNPRKKRDMEELRTELEEFRAWRKSKRSGAVSLDPEPPF
jgi:hypothetical protein